MSTVTEARRRPAETTRAFPPGPSLGGWLTAAFVAAAAAVTAYLVSWGVRHNPVTFMDLSVYRLGVRAWLQGQDMYGTLPATSFGNHLPFIYPPFAAVPFAPVTWVSWQVTWWSWTLLSLASLALVIYLVARAAWPAAGRRGWILVTSVLLPASLMLQPVTDTFWFGQVNVLLMALVAADLLVEKPRWPRGLLIGIAAAVKLTPAGFVLIFLLRKDFRSTKNAAIGAVAATALGFAVNWSGSMRFWFGDTGLSRAADSFFASNQTIRAALERMNLPGPLRDGLWLTLALLVAALVVIGIRRVLRSGAPDATALAMVLTAALLLTAAPTAWGHHWVWVVPALAVMLVRARRSLGWLAAFVATFLVFWVRPFSPAPSRHMYVFWWRAFPELPQQPDSHHHMHWTVAEHIYGNLYVLLTAVLLLAFVLISVRARRTATPAPATPTATTEAEPAPEPAT